MEPKSVTVPGDHPSDVAFFGVDPATGGLLRPPSKWADVREGVIETFRLRERLADVQKKKEEVEAQEETRHRGRPPQGIDAEDLASAGWGVIYAAGVDPAVKEALKPLLDHRESQAGRRFKVFDGDKALIPGKQASDWLLDLDLSPGIGDVRRVPYYLTVVGSPEELPFGVEFDLAGSSYAVGRLAFDEPDAYARYARNVIAAETAPPRSGKPLLTFAGTSHPKDATEDSRRFLVEPLIEELAGTDGWEVETVLGDDVTKPRMAEVLGGGKTPSLFFFAGHGLGPAPGGGQDRIGALLCAPYPGPAGWKGGPLPEEWIFAARDVDPKADLRGLVAVLFGCFTAGMPACDSFCLEPPRPIGDGRAAMSALAARLLSHERGALAVVGHVDRAWNFSYRWRNKVTHPHTFRSVLRALLTGESVGMAASYLGDRYNAVMRDLLYIEGLALRGMEFDPDRFVVDWMTERDARAYLVYGDPAVRVTV